MIVCDYNATTNFVPGRHLSILHDVTEMVEAQQHREQCEDRFRRMLDALDPFALVTDLDGRVPFVNRAMLSSLVVGEQLARSQPDGETQHAAYLSAIANEEITREWENEMVVADGSRRRIKWSSAFVRDARGRIEAVASIGAAIAVDVVWRRGRRLHRSIPNLGISAGRYVTLTVADTGDGIPLTFSIRSSNRS